MASVANLLIDNFCTNRSCLLLAGFNANSFIQSLWLDDYQDYVYRAYIGFKPTLLADRFLVNLLPPFPTSYKQEGFNFFQQLLNLDNVALNAQDEVPRIANFCAAVPTTFGLEVNSEQIICFELLEPISQKALKAIDITKVWGQAYRLVRMGKNYLWQTKEKEVLKAYQKRFKYGQYNSLEKIALLKKFAVGTVEQHDLFLSTMQIMQRLNKDFANLNPARLHWELMQMGCECELNKEDVKGWYLDWAAKESK